jgi:hypothetical protein
VRRSQRIFLLVVIATLPASFCAAQFWGRGRRASRDGFTYTDGGVPVNENTVKTAREIAEHSGQTPSWTNAPGFNKDVFTFVRVIRDQMPWGSGSRSAGRWITDFPDSDLNLSFRLQQVTSMKVDPDGRVLRLTDPDLFNHPWIYMVEPGSLLLRDEEVPILRKYLLNGGVLMADDFWGQVQWSVFERQIKRVLPEREFVELPMDHPLFHCVFDLKVPKNKLQTPSIRQGIRSQYDGVTWEYHDGEEGREMHVRAIFDDKGRIMIIATHNCDNGDSWEREGENDYFFHEFSEKRGYPLGINIIFYMTTH